MAYLLAAAVVVAMTITPLPAPPSWLVLAYISLQLDAHAVGVVLAGALGAAVGRTTLAAVARRLGPRVMSAAARANVDHLARRLEGRRGTLGAAVVLAVSPPPSGALYTAAGLLRVHLALVAGACFAGRLVTYGVGVSLAGAAADDLADRLHDWVGPWSITLGVLLLAVPLYLLGRLDWEALLDRRRLRLRRT